MTSTRNFEDITEQYAIEHARLLEHAEQAKQSKHKWLHLLALAKLQQLKAQYLVASEEARRGR